MGSNVVKNEAEDIVLDEEGVAQGLQHKVLHEGLGGVLHQQKISKAYDMHDFEHSYDVLCQDS